MWTILFVSLFGSAAAQDTCPDHAAAAAVDEALKVEQTFFNVDSIAYDMARHRLPTLITCADEQLSTLDAATIHRAMAIITYVDGDLDASRRAFGAVRVLQPDWRPTPGQLLPEHPMWAVFAAAAEQVAAQRELTITTLPMFGWLVDGMEYPRPGDTTDEHGRPAGTYGLPADRAFILQLLGEDDQVIYTGYHLSTVDVPVTELSVSPDPRERARRRRNVVRAVGTSVGGALLAGAAVTLGMGVDAGAPFLKDKKAQDPLLLDSALKIQDEANFYGKISAGLGGAGAAMVGMAWTIPW